MIVPGRDSAKAVARAIDDQPRGAAQWLPRFPITLRIAQQRPRVSGASTKARGSQKVRGKLDLRCALNPTGSKPDRSFKVSRRRSLTRRFA